MAFGEAQAKETIRLRSARKTEVCGLIASVDCVCIAGSRRLNEQGAHGWRREGSVWCPHVAPLCVTAISIRRGSGLEGETEREAERNGCGVEVMEGEKRLSVCGHRGNRFMVDAQRDRRTT